MLSQLSILVFLLCLTSFAKCQVPFPGSCPEVNGVVTFDLDRYMGTWYENSKYQFNHQFAEKCQQAVYKKLGNSTISVSYMGLHKNGNRPRTITGIGKVIAPGKLAVAFRNILSFLEAPATPNYFVLDTDYENYVVAYRCINTTEGNHSKFLWILTRDRQPSEETIAAATKVLKNNNLPETLLVQSNQSDCPATLDN